MEKEATPKNWKEFSYNPMCWKENCLYKTSCAMVHVSELYMNFSEKPNSFYPVIVKL